MAWNFCSGELSLKDEPWGRHKSVLNEDQLKTIVEANSKTVIQGLAADFRVSATTISQHPTSGYNRKGKNIGQVGKYHTMMDDHKQTFRDGLIS